MITEHDCPQSVIDATLNAVWTLPVEGAERVMAKLRVHVTSAREGEVGEEFLTRFQNLSFDISRRRGRLQAELEFFKSPEKILRWLTKDPEPNMIVGTKGQYDAVLITATSRERSAALEMLHDDPGLQVKEAVVNGRYIDAFEWSRKAGNSWSVALAQPSDKGPLPMQALVSDLRNFAKPPKLVLMVGCCLGFPERGVEIGDVIIARRVQGYQRRRHDGPEIKVAPDPYPIEAELGELINLSISRLDFVERAGCRIHYKDFASAEDLINDQASTLRQSVLELSTEIVAFEMEGQGLAHALWEARRHKTPIIGAVIKGVSDFGDGQMAIDKDQRQRKATRNALRVALELMRNHPDASGGEEKI
jgi:nucleoside phosphorylase